MMDPIVETYKIFSINTLSLRILSDCSLGMKLLLEFSTQNLLIMVSLYMDWDNLSNLLNVSF